MYSPIELPSELPAPVVDVVRGAIDPRLADVHAMLRLPLNEDGFEAGCNLSIADLLFGVLEGVSTILWPRFGNTTVSFRECLERHFHSEAEVSVGGLPSSELSVVLWTYFRNVMQHTLGIALKQPDKQGIRFPDRHGEMLIVFRDKGSLTESELVELERSREWPAFLRRPTLARTTDGLNLSVDAFYVGTRRLIGSVLADRRAMECAAAELTLVRNPPGAVSINALRATMVNSAANGLEQILHIGSHDRKT